MQAVESQTRVDRITPCARGTAVVVRVGHGKPYERLLVAGREEGADLIVLGVHGRSALDLGVFGSTTNQMVRAATCPVLTVRG